MCAIKIMESTLGSTTILVNSCDNISALRRVSINPEAVKPRCKQADLIYRLSDAYQSIEFGMSLVHVYGHRNSGNPALNLTPPASLNLILDALAEHIIASFLISPATKN